MGLISNEISPIVYVVFAYYSHSMVALGLGDIS
jgi:hypothetical protein